MKFAIVTGVSRGLGEAVAKLFLESGVSVLGISRNANDYLQKIAEQHHVSYEHFSCDLGKTAEVEQTIAIMSEFIFNHEPTKLYLVNNAAVLEPIDQAMNIKGEELAFHVHVNTVAPMMLMNAFLLQATEKDIPFIGVTVTSGAAERPVYGWSAYCSSKASINLYTETVALEQKETKTGNKVIAFNPGVMDTNMQEKIRSSSSDEFRDVERFKDYKKNNDLQDVLTVGGVLVDILLDESNVENGKIYNVKDYLGI